MMNGTMVWERCRMKLKELNKAAWIRVIILAIGFALSSGGFIWLFSLSWRLGLCVFLILWGEGIMKKVGKKS